MIRKREREEKKLYENERKHNNVKINRKQYRQNGERCEVNDDQILYLFRCGYEYCYNVIYTNAYRSRKVIIYYTHKQNRRHVHEHFLYSKIFNER